MPRVNLNIPKTDKLKAIALERKHQLKMSYQDIADSMGTSLRVVNYMMCETASEDWPIKKAINLCIALQISPEEFRDSLDYRM